MRKFIYLALLAVTTPALAGPDEYLEVIAPDLSGDSGGTGGIIIGGTIGSGFGGSGGTKATAKTVTQKGQKDAKDTKEKKEKGEKEKDENSFLDRLLGLFFPRTTVIKAVADILKIHDVKTSYKETYAINPHTGEPYLVSREGECRSTNNDQSKPACTEIMKQKFKDPEDNKEKLIITVREYYEIPKQRPTIFSKYDRIYRDGFSFVAEGENDVYEFFDSI